MHTEKQTVRLICFSYFICINIFCVYIFISQVYLCTLSAHSFDSMHTCKLAIEGREHPIMTDQVRNKVFSRVFPPDRT